MIIDYCKRRVVISRVTGWTYPSTSFCTGQSLNTSYTLISSNLCRPLQLLSLIALHHQGQKTWKPRPVPYQSVLSSQCFFLSYPSIFRYHHISDAQKLVCQHLFTAYFHIYTVRCTHFSLTTNPIIDESKFFFWQNFLFLLLKISS